MTVSASEASSAVQGVKRWGTMKGVQKGRRTWE